MTTQEEINSIIEKYLYHPSNERLYRMMKLDIRDVLRRRGIMINIQVEEGDHPTQIEIFTKTTVGNLKDGRSPEDVYIGRPSPWGNPFKLKNAKDSQERHEVIRRYEIWLREQIKLGTITVSSLASLAGKRLTCWCKPLECHGDILISYVDWATKKILEE